MRCDKMMTMAAATLLALGLTARAEDEQDVSRKPEAETAEQRRDAEAAERERRRDRDAGQREIRRDAETAEGERRRDEGKARDRERTSPALRGRARGETMRPGMQGPGGMRGMPGARMRGMMMGQGMEALERMDGRPPMERLREMDPEMFELEQNDQRFDLESHELAEQYRRAPEGPARDELRAKLHETVKRHFRARQERRELEVKRLQAQVERLRGAVERRAKDADAIIEQRISQLLGEEEFGF